MFSLCLFVYLSTELHKLLLNTNFTKLGGKVAHGPRNNPLDFDGNLDHVTLLLGLGLRLRLQLTLHVIPGKTKLRLDEGRVTPCNTGYGLPCVCLTLIKGVCWALA